MYLSCIVLIVPHITQRIKLRSPHGIMSNALVGHRRLMTNVQFTHARSRQSREARSSVSPFACGPQGLFASPSWRITLSRVRSTTSCLSLVSCSTRPTTLRRQKERGHMTDDRPCCERNAGCKPCLIGLSRATRQSPRLLLSETTEGLGKEAAVSSVHSQLPPFPTPENIQSSLNLGTDYGRGSTT